MNCRLLFAALLLLPLTACGRPNGGGPIMTADAGPVVMAIDGVAGTGTGAYCAACVTDADCNGGFCLMLSNGSFCGTDCSAGQACAADATCETVTDSSGAMVGMNCAPTSQACPDSTACTTDVFADWPNTFFNDHCARCHGTEFAAGADVAARASFIASYISNGSMPQDEVLTAADRDRILTWLGCGAP